MNSQENKTLTLLRQLWVSGNKIFTDLDSPNSQDKYYEILKAKRWIEEAKVYFSSLFYSSKFEDEFIHLIDSGQNEYNYNVEGVMNLLLGHIAALGKMLKYGYVKDQFSGINNDTSSKCFVAMSFDKDLEDIFSLGIQPGVSTLGYEVIRVDKVAHNDKIDSKICELINQSRFVIADFTRQRNGVYYEAGYAKGLGLPVIQTCEHSDFSNLHFDIKTIHTIRYQTAAELKNLLQDHVEKSIGRYSPVQEPPQFLKEDMPF
ncbi:MAG: hypothetical protein PHH77_06505 [Victivallaceae bacterium]|nr:hypothetical protein [Victivallaceae bacterium]